MQFVLIMVQLANAGTFREDFEDGDFEGWRIESHPPIGSWKVIDGVVESRRKSPAGTYLIIGEESWTDYTISYDLMLKEVLNRSSVGFIARFKSPMPSHLIDIWCGDWAGFAAISTERMPGNFRTNKPFPLLKLNQWHQMKLVVKGKTFSFWINNQKVLVHKDEVVKKELLG